MQDNDDNFGYKKNDFFISDLDDIFSKIPFDPIRSSFKNLTPREKEVLIFALKGFTNKYTANSLHIKEGTVKKLLHNCYQKLSVNSRTELISLFIFTGKN